MNYTKPEVYEFISKQKNDPIVEWKTCEISGQPFAIFQSDLDFYDKVSPVFNSKKYKIPTPRLCPEERQRRRLLFRNERKLYKRVCDASQKTMISIYSPDKNYKVYKQDIWRGDNWDSMLYGKNFSFDVSFSECFGILTKEVPVFNLANSTCENIEYGNYMNDSSNCYLCFGSGYLENSFYSNWCYGSKGMVDCGFSFRGEYCYEILSCENVYNSFFCKESSYISNCYFCENCHNCEFCFGCSSMSNKKYCIANVQYEKEQYFEKVETINEKQIKYSILKLAKEIHNSEYSIGDKIKNCKNVIFCFEVDKSLDCKYGYQVIEANDSFDISNFGYGSLTYEYMGGGYCKNVLFCTQVVNANNLFYCISCVNNCQNCFACVGLKNKQYSKEEYEKLVPQIIEKMMETGEWGEFFNPSLSPFGYNETVAQEYFPLTREEALARGYKRQDNNYDPKIPEGVETVKGEQVLELEKRRRDSSLRSEGQGDIVGQEILKKIFVCEVSGRPFIIIKQELDFYRKHNLSLPRKHPDTRHEERLKQRPPRELHLRNCDKCGKEILSVYKKAPLLVGEGLGGGQIDKGQKIYCEECYQKEVF